jgi:tyrosinase
VRGGLAFGPGRHSELHNRVHVWIGAAGHLANDPAFYINHCNVDRIWEAWIVKHGRNYLSSGTESGAPVGHTA